MSKTSYLLALALFHDQQKNNQILYLWMFNIQCFLSGEMFGMKFRDRELPAPPLENSVESTKKTSVETTRKTLLETRTSKTETVKKVQAASPQFPRPNGRLSSCLEVWQRTKRFLYIIYFFQVSGEPWYKPVDRKTAEEMVKKGKRTFVNTFTFFSVPVGKNGCFLVRDSIHGGVDSPLTLTLFNNDKVFNISIRLRSDGKVLYYYKNFIICECFRWLLARRSQMNLATAQWQQWLPTIRC